MQIIQTRRGHAVEIARPDRLQLLTEHGFDAATVTRYGNTTVIDARAPRQGGADRRTPDTQCDRQDYRTAAKANRIVPIYTLLNLHSELTLNAKARARGNLQRNTAWTGPDQKKCNIEANLFLQTEGLAPVPAPL